ncbi:hypothetical protein BN938_1556 [Mucinivorans hirudinis]|uniref:Uncharacterized protein n=1 Tax=Mucinivorans hirudinis TaxID=1433126 RepID=A0A060RCT4_9BACT|nr:hypothetical protein BN938_1556 [Mucinivorans hirudinis]
MPVEREKYDLRLVRGNVNLAQGRFITKAEADAIVEKFIQMEIPYKQ